MSRTIGSPGRDDPLGRLVMGRGGVRPGADDRELRRRRGPRRRGARGPRARRPPRSGRRGARRRSGRRPGRRRAPPSVRSAISSASLTIRSRPQDGRRELERGAGQALPGVAAGGAPGGRPRRRSASAPAWPADRLADHHGDQRMRVVGLVPGDDRQIAGRGRWARPRRRRLEARDDERPAAGRGDHRASSAARAASPRSPAR